MLFGKKPIGTIAYLGGVPTLPSPFVWSWTQMIEYNNDYLVNPGQSIFYDKSDASYHAFARNSLVKRMRGEWLLLLDTDHIFDPDVAKRMIDKMNLHNIDVLTGFYQYKFYPYAPVLYRWDKKSYQVLGDWDRSVSVQQIDSAGAGCLMVRRKVFDRIVDELKEEPFEIISPFSEDHSFFHRLRKLKIDAYFDASIQYHHLVFKPVTLEDYDIDEFPKKKVKVRGKKERMVI